MQTSHYPSVHLLYSIDEVDIEHIQPQQEVQKDSAVDFTTIKAPVLNTTPMIALCLVPN